jgi:hypothetical protein
MRRAAPADEEKGGDPEAADFRSFARTRAIVMEDEIPFNLRTWP